MSEEAQSAHPPRFLADVNFNRRVLGGLRRRQPSVDVVTAQDLHLREVSDPELLAHAKMHGRILLTHDINTMPAHFHSFLAALTENEHSPGVMLIPQELSIGKAIDALLLVWACSAHEEWRDRFTYLPL